MPAEFSCSTTSGEGSKLGMVPTRVENTMERRVQDLTLALVVAIFLVATPFVAYHFCRKITAKAPENLSAAVTSARGRSAPMGKYDILTTPIGSGPIDMSVAI